MNRTNLLSTDRRSFLIWGLRGCLVASVTPNLLGAESTSTSTKAESVDLAPRAAGMVRVKTILEAEGSLELPSPQGKDLLQVPIHVQGEHFFDQREFGNPTSEGELPCWRHYWEAKVSLDIQDKREERALRKSLQLQLLAAQGDSNSSFVYGSPSGPMTREELDLLDVTATRFRPEALLPLTPVAVNGTWEHSSHIAQQLLNISEVRSGTLTSKLESTDDTTAKLALSGTIEGTVDGVQTEIEVIGMYHVERVSRVVTWLTLSVHERREDSFSAPAFDVVSRIRMARQSIAQSDALTDRVVQDLPQQHGPTELLLEFVDQEKSFRMMVDRRAVLISQTAAGSVWRLIDQNKLLATGKIDRLNKLPPGKDITLVQFQSDVRTALGNSVEKLEETSETENSHGVRILRVSATGKVAGVPITWIYYHLGHPTGIRLSAIFTLESGMKPQLGGLDEVLVSSVEILPQPEANERQPGSTTSPIESARRPSVDSR